MVDQQLVSYIKEAKSKGAADDMIRHVLLGNGWDSQVVAEAFQAVSLGQSAPLPPGMSTAPPPMVTPSPGYYAASASSSSPARKSSYSAYSVLLALVLFFSLLVLINQLVDDVRENFGDNISARLIIDALIILPFLLAASAIHFSLQDEKKKYMILSQPYYIVSGFLLIRLLFNVSNYILNKDTAYGVYIVLSMIIVVLTGIIVFVLRYLRNK